MSAFPLRQPERALTLAATAGTLSSFLVDSVVRSTAKSNLYAESIEMLPVIENRLLRREVARRFLQLNCLTRAFSSVWEESTNVSWSIETPIRVAEQRRAAEIEIDALVAISFGVTVDELCTVYRTQYSVMQQYDSQDLFDANGRKVADDVAKLERKLKPGQELNEEDRTWTHPQSGATYLFEYPFRILDRETDMRAAYERFERELAEGELK